MKLFGDCWFLYGPVNLALLVTLRTRLCDTLLLYEEKAGIVSVSTDWIDLNPPRA